MIDWLEDVATGQRDRDLSERILMASNQDL